MSTETEDLDLSAALEAAMDSVDAGEPAPEAEPVEHEAPEVDLDAALGEPEVEQPEKQEEPVEQAPEREADQAPAQELQPDDRAPSTWKPAVAEKWKDLPPEVRAEIQRRESDYHKGIEQYKQGAAIAQEVQQVVTPYMQNFQAAGVHPLQAINHLLGVEHTLRNGSPEQKAQKLAEIARDYGIDLQAVAPLPPMDPQVQALVAQNHQLQNFRMMVEQQQQQAVMSEIEAFRANPENVHFEAVKDDMALLLQAGKAESLQDAYDKAVWMRPDIRQTLVHQQSANAQKQQAEAARRQRAQSAAVGVKGSAPSKTTTTQHGDLRSALEAAFDGES